MKYSRLEVLCVLAWFAMDGAWLLGWAPAVYTFGIVAFSLAAGLFLGAPGAVLMLVAAADLCWLSMNLTWAVSDLTGWAEGLAWAKGLLVVGILLSGLAAAQGIPLRRLRIFTYFRRS